MARRIMSHALTKHTGEGVRLDWAIRVTKLCLNDHHPKPQFHKGRALYDWTRDLVRLRRGSAALKWWVLGDCLGQNGGPIEKPVILRRAQDMPRTK